MNLDDSQTNDDFEPGSILGAFSKSSTRFNIFVKVADGLWEFITDRGYVRTKMKFQDIQTNSMSPLQEGAVHILHHVKRVVATSEPGVRETSGAEG